MSDFPSLVAGCPHCEEKSFVYDHALEHTENFRILCDVHPLCEGHLLIVPREHISCMGDCPPLLFGEFLNLYARCSRFLRSAYGNVSTFEHGKIGQTVFHAHTHLMPVIFDPVAIIPEGLAHLEPCDGVEELPLVFSRKGQYLFFSINDDAWLVDTALGAPRFFRDRFAAALGRPERGNWKTMREDAALMREASEEIAETKRKWSLWKQR